MTFMRIFRLITQLLLWTFCMGYSAYEVIFENNYILIIMFFMFLILFVLSIKEFKEKRP